MDGSLRDAEWYEQYFERIREDFSNVKIGIIQVSAPREAVFQRAAVSPLVLKVPFVGFDPFISHISVRRIERKRPAEL